MTSEHARRGGRDGRDGRECAREGTLLLVARLTMAISATVMLTSCGLTTIDEHPCPPEGTTLTYESFGRQFLDQYCQRCHGAVGPNREGAPSAYDFGSAEDARAWRERIFARSALDNTSMPPGPDDPPDAERAKLADWLACGAP